MKLSIYQVDAFSNRLFSGNPAAIIVTDDALPDALMQSIASENNLAETAFVFTTDAGYAIRWFTPVVEVDLCGHATLAAAHVFFDHLAYSLSRITFHSKSGPLHVYRENGLLWLDFPADTLKSESVGEDIEAALGCRPLELYRGRDDYMAVLADEAAVASLAPDMALLSRLPSRGIIVTAPGETADFVSRMFAPQSGILEDPVTGSAHTTLAPYWAKHLGQSTLSARQLSIRGGELQCRLIEDRVHIGGKAVTYMVGQISL
jgi:PhzF family phenazine biosynthesis protein